MCDAGSPITAEVCSLVRRGRQSGEIESGASANSALGATKPYRGFYPRKAGRTSISQRRLAIEDVDVAPAADQEQSDDAFAVVDVGIRIVLVVVAASTAEGEAHSHRPGGRHGV